MPLLLAGLRKNTSLLRFRLPLAHLLQSTTTEETTDAGGWMQETEGLGHRNRFLSLLRASKAGAPRYLVACACPGINTH
jgi:hypothetical protein